MTKWENLGLLFNTEDLKKIDENLSFAKSPQAIVKEKSVIFYFTSQVKDKNNKWLSRPYWVEFDQNLTSIIRYSSEHILDVGDLGTFDEHGIFPFSVTATEDGYTAYTTGWSRRSSVDIDMSIGMATSKDGYHFKKCYPGPIMSSNYSEPFMVGDAFVRAFNGQWHMWYIFGDRWLTKTSQKIPQRHYKIAKATSDDRVSWSRSGHFIIDPVRKEECQALPSVAYYRGKYHMIFCHRDVFDFRLGGERAYKLGYASSSDLTSWVRDDTFFEGSVLRREWDLEMQCYPNLFVLNNELYCAYNGNNFGENGFGVAKIKF
ncbi:hypothetical protein [Kiloniella majae]|uniref:hypothetical protein n=1 Tax=Kiloniella majae TaxID=1938558 RepID=UPI000A277008|nr:hypothetical protein [Kiloniella majae]